MPLEKPKKGATKKQRQKVASRNISELDGTGRPLKQRIAIGLESAGLSNKKKKAKRKKPKSKRK